MPDQSGAKTSVRLQVFGQRRGANVRRSLDDDHPGQHGGEHDQQCLGIAYDSQRVSLQQQIAHDATTKRGKGGEDQGSEQ